MDKINGILLKIKYPFLKQVKLFSNGGIYDTQGVDLHIFTNLYNTIKNNDTNLFFDINRPKEFNLSLSNLFLDILSSTSVIIYDQFNDSIAFNNLDFHDSNVCLIENDFDYGLTPVHAENSKFINSIYLKELLATITNKNIHCALLSINFDFDAVNVLNNIVYDIKFQSILVYNTSTYNKKINQFRNYLLTLGYVFYSRINNKHDFFILTESINGFESNMICQLQNCTLTKWASLPPNCDYTITK